jgi:hypothetical protein
MFLNQQEEHMIRAAIRFVRMPWLLILIWVVARFSLGLAGVPYAPRGNAMFSVMGLTIISCLYFGALSKHNFTWKGTLVVGIAIGLFAQVLIFLATLISCLGGLQTYFVHWDALNVPEGTVVPMGAAMAARSGGLLIGGVILPSIVALIGRALGGLAPDK